MNFSPSFSQLCVPTLWFDFDLVHLKKGKKNTSNILTLFTFLRAELSIFVYKDLNLMGSE